MSCQFILHLLTTDFKKSQDFVPLIANLDEPCLIPVGIEDAFLEVSKQLIHLYETVPNSGMGSLVTQQAPDLFSTDQPLKLPDRKDDPASTGKAGACTCWYMFSLSVPFHLVILCMTHTHQSVVCVVWTWNKYWVTRLGPKLGQIGLKWDKFGDFFQIQYILA